MTTGPWSSSTTSSGTTSAPEGYKIKLEVSDTWGPPYMEIGHSDIMGGIDAVDVCPQCNLTWGDGMIDADPLFTTGPDGDHYLSQLAAGQAEESPCVDTGSEPAADISFDTPDGLVSLSTLSTRTDRVTDRRHGGHGVSLPGSGQRDDYHRAGPGRGQPAPGPCLPCSAGCRTHPRVRSLRRVEFRGQRGHRRRGRYPGSELLTGAGPGAIYGPHVRGFTIDGEPVDGLNFLAYGTNKWGVNVAAGDLDGDGKDEIITGAGPGAVFGPHVRAFSYTRYHCFRSARGQLLRLRHTQMGG